MMGIDTNVLVRYIVQDDPKQALKATQFIEEQCSRDNPVFINTIVLCELVWVLKRLYKVKKAGLLVIIEKILRTAQLRVQHPQVVWRALQEFKNNNADFADCLVGQINKDNGCELTVSFDSGASDLETFQLLF